MPGGYHGDAVTHLCAGCSGGGCWCLFGLALFGSLLLLLQGLQLVTLLSQVQRPLLELLLL